MLHNSLIKKLLLVSLVCFLAKVFPVSAEDCTSSLPGTDCTIDENTTAPLTIGSGIVLTTGADISINHTINGSVSDGDGTIQTNSGGVTIIQNEAIGDSTAIDSLSIGNGDSWTTYAPILTNNDGADIDLGAGDGGEAIVFNNGSSFIGVIDGNGGDNVSFGGDGMGGIIEAGGAIQSVNVNVISGILNIDDPIGNVTPISGLNIANGATLNSNSNITTSGAFDLDGFVSLDSGNVISADTYVNDADGGLFDMGINRSSGVSSSAVVNIQSGGPVDFSSDSVRFNVELGSETLVTDTLASAFIGNGGVTLAPQIIDNNYLYDFSFIQSGNNLDLSISQLPLDIAAYTNNNLNSANMVLLQMNALPDPNIQAIQNNLMNASSGEHFNGLLSSTQPPSDGSSAVSARLVQDETSRLIHDRMSTFRTKFPAVRSVTKSASRGRVITTRSRYKLDASRPQSVYSPTLTALEPAAGDEAENTRSDDSIAHPSVPSFIPNKTRRIAERRRRYLQARQRNSGGGSSAYDKGRRYYSDDYESGGVQLWAHAFATSAEQGARDGQASYDVSGSGVTFGVDTGDMHDKLTLGLALSYADTDINSNGFNNTNSEVQTYQTSFYSSYHFDNDYYFSGIFSYAMSDVSGRRFNIGGTSLVGNSQYDAEQIALSAAFGRNIIFDRDFLIQPSLQADYAFMEFEQYREDGAQGAGLRVRQSALNSLAIGPYLKFASNQDIGEGIGIVPEAGIGYSYDIIQDTVNAVSSFQAFDADGPVEFSTRGFDPQAHNLDLDLATNFEYKQLSGRLGYNLDYQGDLVRHTGSVNFSYHF